MMMLDGLVIRLNRLRTRASRRRFEPERVLLLLPHCLQNQKCAVRLVHDLDNCKGCGKCKMKELQALARQWRVQAYIASGGREAAQRARSPEVDLIVAVACPKELAEGIRAMFPKKVIGVMNAWPHGACKDTDVDVAAVESLLRRVLSPEQSKKEPLSA